ncbi:MAG: hypothetical protein ACRD2M_03680 [Terriglobales bacterium]
MYRKQMFALLLVLGMFTAAGSVPYFQQKDKPDKAGKSEDKDKKKSGKEDEDKPAPLFGGKVGLKSSRQSKDQATLGFNGIGPNGQVEQGALNSATAANAIQKAAALSTYTVPASEVDAFIKEGNLGPAAPPKKTGARPVENPKRQASARSERRGDEPLL